MRSAGSSKAWKICEREHVLVTVSELLVQESPQANPSTVLHENLGRINEGTPGA